MTHSMKYLSKRWQCRNRNEQPDVRLVRNIYWYMFFDGVQRQTLTLN